MHISADTCLFFSLLDVKYKKIILYEIIVRNILLKIINLDVQHVESILRIHLKKYSW